MTAANIKQLVWASTLVAALSTGLMAGVFFAFSTFVMKGLARLPIPQGIQAMQSINLTAVTPVFMAALFGSTALCVLLAVYSLMSWPQQPAFYLFLGSLLYLLGSFLTTVAVQRATQQCSGSGRSRKRGRCETLGPLSHVMDGLEPCTDGIVNFGVGSLRLRARPVQSLTLGSALARLSFL